MNKISLTLECDIDDVDPLLALYEILRYDKASWEEKGTHIWSDTTQENCKGLFFLVARHVPLVLEELYGDTELALEAVRNEFDEALEYY